MHCPLFVRYYLSPEANAALLKTLSSLSAPGALACSASPQCGVPSPSHALQ